MTARRTFETVFLGTDRNAVSTIRDMRREAEGLQRQQGTAETQTIRSTRANNLLNNSYVRQGIALAGVSVSIAGAVQLTRGAISAAENLSQSVDAVNTVFGDSADVIHEWGETTATSFGLSTRAFNDLATPLGAMLRNLGIKDFAQQTITLTERAADLASVFNTDVASALTAVNAAMRGEADPIERYGVRLTAATVEARALADTGKTLTSTLTDQEKAIARINLIMDQSAFAAGNFRDNQDELTQATQTLRAEWENLNAELGRFVSPIAAKVVGGLADITRGVNDLTVALQSGRQKARNFFDKLGGELFGRAGDLAGDILRMPRPEDLLPTSGGEFGLFPSSAPSGAAPFIGVGRTGDEIDIFTRAGEDAARRRRALLDRGSQFDDIRREVRRFQDMAAAMADAVEETVSGGGGGSGLRGLTAEIESTSDWVTRWGAGIEDVATGPLYDLTIGFDLANEKRERELEIIEREIEARSRLVDQLSGVARTTSPELALALLDEINRPGGTRDQQRALDQGITLNVTMHADDRVDVR